VDYVTDMAAKRAELTPDRIAFRDHDTARTLTFADVDDQANRAAHALLAQGAPPATASASCATTGPSFSFCCLRARRPS
jgi:fatty-acyl-CoA synthase